MNRLLDNAKRVVVKIGSSLLVNPESGELRQDWLKSLIADVAALKSAGKDVMIVSSGAVALGRRDLSLDRSRLKLDEKQAAAAVGQIRLAHAYQDALAAHGLTVAQLLVTLDDTEERRRYLNARATVDTLLRMGVVPVINENDTVATAEIRFGDNDRLAARVAVMAGADLLVLLSDIDGLYTADPTTDETAEHIAEVEDISTTIEGMAGQARDGGPGSGGMITKIAAAKIAVAGGCHMLIGNGRVRNPVGKISEGARTTWFKAVASPRAARKKWISGILQATGSLVVDAGAVDALRRGKSLLPAGVKAVNGTFDRGDAVRILDENGTQIARGLVAYGAADASAIMGARSRDIEDILGFAGRDVMVHRDDLVLD